MNGSQRLGPYELFGELGRGAMACVWRAWDPNLEREVAIKEPLFDARLPQSVLDEMGRRFVSEGRTQAGLSHPGIIAVYAANVWDGRPAIVMELVNGETLSSRLRRGPMQPNEALYVLDQLLDTVGYAHARGVVHRDIKPDNIFLTYDGRVKLGDFGIARTGDGQTMATVAGAVLGTPGYMSPEQATGRPVDARSDLFAVGVTAYEMLTGVNPFGAGSDTDVTSLLYRIVHEPAPDLPEWVSEGLPADLRPAIMCALAKDPAQRPQTASEFSALLHGSTQVLPKQAVPIYNAGASAPARANSAGRRPSWLPYAIVAGVALIGLVFALSSALSGSGGGGGGGTAETTQQQAAATGSQTKSSLSSSDESAEESYYLGISNDMIAIFTEGSDDPVEVSDVQIANLDESDVTALTNHVSVSSLDEGKQRVEEYRAAAEENIAAQQQAAIPEFPYAEASSWIPGDDITAYYGPYNVLDGDVMTAWNEGVVGTGAGEWVSINADTPQTVTGVAIMNGYPKSEEIYQKNNRPREVTVQLSDGTSFAATLQDSYREVQMLDFGGTYETTYIRVIINSVYEGSEWNDTAICEIQAY